MEPSLAEIESLLLDGAFAALAALAAGGVDESPAGHLLAAGRSLVDGAFGDAVSHFDRVLARRDDDDAARLGKAWALSRLGATGEAERLLWRVADDARRSTLAELVTGSVAALRGQLLPAVEAYDRAIERTPELYAPRLELAEWLTDLGSPDDAEALLEEAIGLWPLRAAAYHQLALLWRAMGRAGDARELFERAVAGPLAEEPGALHALAVMRIEAGETGDELVVLAERLLAMVDAGPDERVEIAKLMLTSGKLDRARTLADEALAERPDLAEAHYLLGQIHELTEDRREAAEAYERAFASDANHWRAANNLVVLLLAEGGGDEQLDRIAGLLDVAALAVGDTPELLFNRGQLLRRRSQLRAARWMYQRVLRTAPDGSDVAALARSALQAIDHDEPRH